MVPASWDELLRLAETDPAAPATEDLRPERPAVRRFRLWFKAGFPLLVLVLFGGFKAYESFNWRAWRSDFPVIADAPESLSGVEPTQPQVKRLDERTRSFIASLETLAGQKRWRDLRNAIDDHPSEKIRDHPVVEGLALIARSRSGERSLALERAMMDLEPLLRSFGNRYSDLLHELQLCRVEQILSRSKSPEILARNTDEIFRLLGKEVKTQRDVKVRVDAARVFEEQGDRLMQAAEGLIKVDTYRLREARVYYQTGLRFVVERGRWLERTPVSPRAQPELERLVEKLRIANRKIHGPGWLAPSRDASTWTGRKGDPVHDAP